MEKSGQGDEIAYYKLGRDAQMDLAGIYTYSAEQWGEVQAEMYIQFLNHFMQGIAENPVIGKPIFKRKEYFGFIVRWPKAKHGHNIVYQVTDYGIFVNRILHTSMDARRHVK